MAINIFKDVEVEVVFDVNYTIKKYKCTVTFRQQKVKQKSRSIYKLKYCKRDVIS